MGVTDSRQILANLENQYKSLRKYCDPVYGEITVIQHKTTKQQYALIEKTFQKPTPALVAFFAAPQPHPSLLKLQRYEVCDLSMCSDIRLYFFLFDYTPHTLQQEITRRQSESNPFTKEEALRLMQQELQIAIALRERSNPENGRSYRFLLTNNSFLCSAGLTLKALEPVYRNDPEGNQDFKEWYLSPEAYRCLQRGEIYNFRQVCTRESSIIFTLALNFIECLLLATLEDIYQTASGEEVINYAKLSAACQEVLQTYGEDLYILLVKMTHPDPFSRPPLTDLPPLLRKPRPPKLIRYSNEKQATTEIY